jgi:hypothetical protein
MAESGRRALADRRPDAAQGHDTRWSKDALSFDNTAASLWGTSPEGRRAKFYKLTVAGRKQITAEQDSWRRFAPAIEHVLQGT